VELWQDHYRRILAHTTPTERVVTPYGPHLDDARPEVERLAAFAGLVASDEACAAMKASLRHHDATVAGCDFTMSPELDVMYAALLREATSNHPRPEVPVVTCAPRSADAEPALRTVVKINFAAGPDQIGGAGNLTRIRCNAGTALYESMSNDPQFVLAVPRFGASTVRFARFRMRRGTSVPTSAKIYWTHSVAEEFSESR